MVLSNTVIDDIKDRSSLLFDQAKDFDLLAEKIFSATGRTIGLTTLKRILGYIDDARHTNEYTLNTIALYLGYDSWDVYIKTKRIDSEWCYDDDSVYVHMLPVGTHVSVKYLNRKVDFCIEQYRNELVLKVIGVENSSLQIGDLLFVYKIRKGEILEAEKVIRGNALGNYKTNGEITSLKIE